MGFDNKHIDSDEIEAVKLEIVFEMEEEKESYGSGKNATKHQDVFVKNDVYVETDLKFGTNRVHKNKNSTKRKMLKL